MTLILALVILGVLIFIHELGHFLVAKKAGILVEEFSFGFGPRIVSVRKGETEYSMRALPFGGFVKMAGMTPLEGPIGPRGFLSKTVSQRMGVLFAGPAMNLILAVLLFAGIFVFMGIDVPTLEVKEVLEGHAAERTGILPGDLIVSVNGIALRDWEHLLALINSSLGQETTIVLERDGSQRIFRLTPEPRPEDPSKGFIGISPAVRIERQNPLVALKTGISYTLAIMALWINGLIMMVLGRAPVDVVGPVGIAQMVGEASRMGMRNVFYLSAALSASLGLFNLLPVPGPLDGGRLAFLLYERVRGRPVAPEKENLIHFLGFAVLMVLAVLVTYRDILRWGGS